MSAYKLIKKYPGSPFVGTKAIYVGSRYNFFRDGLSVGHTQSLEEKQEIQNSPEFWQKYFLKTEDNIYKFIGDEIYVINRSTLKDKWYSGFIIKINSTWTPVPSETVKHFHSKQSALEFVEKENNILNNNNKPIFSVNDLKELFNFEFIDKEKYNKFVSEKLGKLQ